MENTKDLALSYAGVNKLPALEKGEFEGLAIVKIKKKGGKETWGIGRYVDGAVKVVKDFTLIGIEAVLEAYPYQVKAKKEKTGEDDLPTKRAKLIALGYDGKDVKTWSNARCDKQFEGIANVKVKLEEAGIEYEDGTLEDLLKLLPE